MSVSGRVGAATEVSDLLRDGDIRLLGLMPRASNLTFLAEVKAGGRSMLAVWKPASGETPLWDFPEGTLHRREVAAYVLAADLGWPSIPVTLLREGPQGPGSLQAFVDADPREHYFTLRERAAPTFRMVAAFDVVANNADRKSGHCLLGSDGEIRVVDHGVCFSADPKLRTVIWDFVGEPLPPPALEGLRAIGGRLRAGALHDALAELLSEEEIEATAARAEELVARGRFPEPGPGRPFPWPPV